MINIIKKIIAYLILLISSFIGINDTNLSEGFNIEKNYVYKNTGETLNEISAINCLNGYLVESINMPAEQRYFKANIIKNINRDIDRITIGSSHMLTIRYEDKSIDHINLSVGGANLKDRLTILGLLHFFNIKYKYINFEIDIPSFTDGAFYINNDFDFLNDYGDYFLKVLNNEDVSDFQYIDFNKNYIYSYEYLGYDLTYKTKDSNSLNGKFYYDKEASQHIPEDLNKGDKTWIDATINNLKFADEPLRNMHINKESVDVMNKLFKYFEDNDVEVNLILIPRAPIVYDSEKMGSFPIVNEIMEYAFSVSKNKGLKISGSLNPHYIDSKNEYYFDGFHLKQEIANSITDFRR